MRTTMREEAWKLTDNRRELRCLETSSNEFSGNTVYVSILHGVSFQPAVKAKQFQNFSVKL